MFKITYTAFELKTERSYLNTLILVILTLKFNVLLKVFYYLFESNS